MKTRRFRLVLAVAGGLLAAALAFTWLNYQDDLRRELARVSSGSRVVDTRCGPIEYASLGTGPAVLLVHGAGGGFDQGLEIAQHLAAHGFQVIAMSRFGYLRTPMPANASPAAQADAHACLLDALGVDRAAIVGISAGAPSSMQFALRHAPRTSAMLLLVPLAYAPPGETAAARELSPSARFVLEKGLRSDLLFWSALKVMPSMVTRTILATPPEVVAAAGAREQARARELMEHILPVSRRQAGMLNDGAIGASIGRYELERIKVPTLVISLPDDLYGTFDSARYTAKHIPGARFVGYPSGGHVWVGHHGEVLAEMVAFLG
jgi:pimeloyl-ACP methyl ester carboxylesterase